MISVFDNGAVPKVHAQSRGLLLAIDSHTKTDSVVAQYEHSAPPLSSASQGSIQTLEDGDVFIGWGSEPYFSEFSAGGKLLYDAHMHGSYESYRIYRFPWTGIGPDAPAIATLTAIAGGPVTVYASWNGDTRTTSWRGSPDPRQSSSNRWPQPLVRALRRRSPRPVQSPTSRCRPSANPASCSAPRTRSLADLHTGCDWLPFLLNSSDQTLDRAFRPAGDTPA